MNLMPVLTALIALLLLSERLRGYHLVGGGTTLAGVLLAQWTQRPSVRANRSAC